MPIVPKGVAYPEKLAAAIADVERSLAPDVVRVRYTVEDEPAGHRVFTRIDAQRPRLARIFEHRTMRTAATRALATNRHTADYDTAKKWSRSQVLTQIDLVQQAFTSWRTIRGQRIANDFLLSLLERERR